MKRGDIIGHQGESIVLEFLATISPASLTGWDVGLDVNVCELHKFPGVEYGVQVKSSLTPAYSKKSITSLPIKRKTVKAWLQKNRPIYLFMVDVSLRRVFYLLMSDKLLKGNKASSVVFNIPLENEITKETIGKFVSEVINSQTHMTSRERSKYLSDHFKKFPELYQDLGEHEKFLEAMRSSDQEIQVQVEFELKEAFEKGVPISLSIRNELLSILRNCKDRITQVHVLHALVYINERRAVREILKQIERNLSIFEYSQRDYGHIDTSYLFDSIVSLKPRKAEIIEEILRFLRMRDENVNHGALVVCAELAIKECSEDILNMLQSKSDYIRLEAVFAITKIADKKLVSRLKEDLRTTDNPRYVRGLIEVFSSLEDKSVYSLVKPNLKNREAICRVASAHYVGVTDVHEEAPTLIQLISEDDYSVRLEATQALISLTIKNETKEELLMVLLRKVLHLKLYDRLSLILPALKACYTGRHSNEISDMYIEAPEDSILVNFTGSSENYGGPHEFNLKAAFIPLIKNIRSEEVEKEILKNLKSSNSYNRTLHILLVNELKLKSGYSVIKSLLPTADISEGRNILNTMTVLDGEQTKKYVLEKIDRTEEDEWIILYLGCLLHFPDDEKVRKIAELKLISSMKKASFIRNFKIFQLIRSYKAIRTTSLLIAALDAEEGLNDHLYYQILYTLSRFRTKEIGDILKAQLKVENQPHTRIILEWLVDFADNETFELAKLYLDDPDLEVKKSAMKLLNQAH